MLGADVGGGGLGEQFHRPFECARHHCLADLELMSVLQPLDQLFMCGTSMIFLVPYEGEAVLVRYRGVLMTFLRHGEDFAHEDVTGWYLQRGSGGGPTRK